MLFTVITLGEPACHFISPPTQLRSDTWPIETTLQEATLSAQEYCGVDTVPYAQKVPKTGSVKLPLAGHCQSTVPVKYGVGCVVHTVAASFHALQIGLSPEM